MLHAGFCVVAVCVQCEGCEVTPRNDIERHTTYSYNIYKIDNLFVNRCIKHARVDHANSAMSFVASDYALL
jgi:hypothetical protein